MLYKRIMQMSGLNMFRLRQDGSSVAWKYFKGISLHENIQNGIQI